jgi:hypothetical protein
MKTVHGGSEGKESTPAKSYSQKTRSDIHGKKCGLNDGHKSAPGRIYEEKMKEKENVPMDEDEAILAANYEPSESSDDFQIQVDNVLGEEAESSKSRSNVWLTICDLLKEPNIMAEQEDSAAQNEIPMMDIVKGGNQGEMDLTKLINPCEEMKRGEKKGGGVKDC